MCVCMCVCLSYKTKSERVRKCPGFVMCKLILTYIHAYACKLNENKKPVMLKVFLVNKHTNFLSMTAVYVYLRIYEV